MSSSIDPALPPLQPAIPPGPQLQGDPSAEKPAVQSLIHALDMQSHIEGGYFVETDRDPRTVPNPFTRSPSFSSAHEAAKQSCTNVTDSAFATAASASDDLSQQADEGGALRNASTSIFYLLTERSPMGALHRNKARTVHTLHRGRGRYVIVHADEVDGAGGARKARVETFVVGQDVERGERLQWIVERGKFKCSFLLPDDGTASGSSGGLLISETVVPGFDYRDHDFCDAEQLKRLVTAEQAKEMEWMVRRS